MTLVVFFGVEESRLSGQIRGRKINSVILLAVPPGKSRDDNQSNDTKGHHVGQIVTNFFPFLFLSLYVLLSWTFHCNKLIGAVGIELLQLHRRQDELLAEADAALNLVNFGTHLAQVGALFYILLAQ